MEKKLLESLCFSAILRNSRFEIEKILFDCNFINNSKNPHVTTSDFAQNIFNKELIVQLLKKGRSTALSTEDKNMLLERLIDTKDGLILAFQELNKSAITIYQYGIIAETTYNRYGYDNELIISLINFIPHKKIPKIQCNKDYKEVLMSRVVLEKLNEQTF